LSFFGELKRRNVFKVVIAYLVAAWLILQVSDVILGNIGAPDWVFKVFLLLLAIGFPLVVVVAWAFEMTPEGLRRERDVDRSISAPSSTGRKLNILIIATLALALGYFAWERHVLLEAVDPGPQDETVSEGSATKGDSAMRSIAVLPFVNMSADPEQEWFADGLTEELLNALARTADLMVTARTSSFKYKGTTEDVPTIARALGVENILEGSVRRSGDRLRVTAQLIRASDGFHLWSQNYDRDMADIIDLQEDLATSIARALQTATDPEELAAMVSMGTRNVAAYQSYLHGVEMSLKAWNGDRGDSLASLKAFEKAVEIDPQFSRAYIGIAYSWAQPRDNQEIISAAIDRAIAYEKDPITKTYYKARRALETGDEITALRLFSEHMESRPNSTTSVTSLIILLRALGRYGESVGLAKAFFERAGYAIDVADATLHSLRDGWNEDPDFALKYARGIIERFPDQPLLIYQAHRVLLATGDIETARKLPGVIRRLNPSDWRPSDWDWRLMLMTLRQLCAEGRNLEAERAFEVAVEDGDFSENQMWVALKVLGRDVEAESLLVALDNAENFRQLDGLRAYGFFDPRPYPYLMGRLEEMGIPAKAVSTLPYRCSNTSTEKGAGSSE